MKEAFERIITRLLKLPGHTKIGYTIDTGDRYAAWFPYDDEKVFVQFILMSDDTIKTDCNITSSGFKL